MDADAAAGKKQILLSVVIRFLIYFVHWMVLAHLPVILKVYGFSDIEIGLAIGIFSLSSMALMLPMGACSDFFSPKRTMLAGALLYGVYFGALLVLRSFAALVPAIVVGGVGSACLIVVSEALYLKHFGGEKRGQRVAVYQVSTYLGFGIGPLAGGFLLEQHHAAMFAVAAGGAAAIFLLCLRLADFAPLDFSIKKYGRDILRPKPILLLACIFVLGSHFGTEQTSISLLMTENLHFSPEEVGALFAGLGLWMAAIVPFIGRLHDQRNSLFLFLLAGLGISGLFQVLTVWADGFWSLLGIRLIHTMGDAFALLELSVLTALFFPSQRLGGNAGLLYAVRTLATFLAAVLAGVVNRRWGYQASFLANGVFVVLFAVASIFYILLNAKRLAAVGWRRSS